jgi:very-short-patch-repair endonuclease
MAATKTLEQRREEFLNRLKELYPDYTLKSQYIDSKTPIILYHENGYYWETEPRRLDGKRQCPEVSRINKNKKNPNFREKMTQESFEVKFYKKWDKKEYKIIGKYVNNRTPIEIFHTKCNQSWFPTPDSMLNCNSKGCLKCYGKRAKTLEDINNDILNLLGNQEYMINEIFTKSGHSYGKFIHYCDLCKDCEFEMRISDFMSTHSQRCPLCAELNKESKAVRNMKSFLEENGISYEQEVMFEGCVNTNFLRFDFYLPDYNLLIEYDGIQHFKPSGFITDEKVKYYQNNDKIKNEWVEQHDVSLLRINYKQNEIKILKEFLNMNCSV